MSNADEQFMSIAIEIAGRGRGAVEPNPMVGAVLARDGVEMARGWHKRFGWPHAEVEALASAEEAGQEAHGATLYVSLEPCCHFGKTPPCTRAIIEAGISRVVAAMADPDERVAGKGLEELRRAGVEVTSGVLEERARELLAPYVKLRKSKRPWVICKWAQTSDGLLALSRADGLDLPATLRPPSGLSLRVEDGPEGPATPGRWISNEASRRDAHRLRGLCDGICVGIGTVLADDPMLTNRSGLPDKAPSTPAGATAGKPFDRAQGKQPGRVVLDAHLRLPQGCWLAQSARTSPVTIATTLEGLAASPGRAQELRQAGVEILQLPAAPEGVSLPALLDELGGRQWTYLLVEGGARVLQSFLRGGLADELVVYVAPTPGGAVGGPRFDIEKVLSDFAFRPTGERMIGGDRLRQFRAKR